MDRKGLIQNILNSAILHQWHWFAPHFTPLKQGNESAFVQSLLDSLLIIGQHLPKLPLTYLNRIASFSGKPYNIRQYEQLMQLLAEILILHQVMAYKWKRKIRFVWEPKSILSNKGPELNLEGADYTIGIEVKSPSLLFHENPKALNRNQESIQPGKMPQFNPMENYLESAREKFSGFKQDASNYFSLLVVVWDHLIHEPISALLNPKFGIFRNSNSYPMVDAVILTQHRALFGHFLKEPKQNYNSPILLDYGLPDTEPYKIIIANPDSQTSIPQDVIDCLQVEPPDQIPGEKYNPANQIPWREFH
ncbi:MAG: hypothetical protein ACEPOZ_02435 [Marinifilaceae bacterium]